MREVGRRWAGRVVGAWVLCVAAPAIAATPSAESLFVSGRFAESDRAWSRVLQSHPRDTLALVRRAQIALFSGDTRAARELAGRAGKAGAWPVRVAALRAESWSREDRMDSAAVEMGRAGKTAIAAQLAALGGAAYVIRGPEWSRVSFEQKDPLPLVALHVNGQGPFLFLIDTGGGELLLDPAIADSVGARRFGADMGVFAGDRKASVEHGTVDSVGLGDFTVARVPIAILPARRFAAVAPGRVVAGVLGTTLLARFRFTLDYPGSALLLERRGSAADTSGALAAEVPFWLAGDHYVLAPGSLKRSGPLLWFIDTGLAGAAFTGPASTLDRAGIALKDTAAFTGTGGGGAVRVVPFRVDSLRLGSVEQSELLGMLGPFPTTLERALGPHVAGIVSHAFLRPYRVTLDFERMRLTLRRPS